MDVTKLREKILKRWAPHIYADRIEQSTLVTIAIHETLIMLDSEKSGSVTDSTGLPLAHRLINVLFNGSSDSEKVARMQEICSGKPLPQERANNSASNPCGGCRWEREPNGPCDTCIRAPRDEKITDKYESVPAQLA